jgi:demethoxyubiquinone hydroxylase (CLK1/Coq7/Cat5 family)
MISLGPFLAVVSGLLSRVVPGRAFLLGLLDTTAGKITSLTMVALVALAVYGHYQQHRGVIAERARQETTDAKISNDATARLHDAHARRVLDPTTLE